MNLSKAVLGLLQHPRWKTLTIITKSSILDVVTVLDPPLFIHLKKLQRKYNRNIDTSSFENNASYTAENIFCK